jgi:TP901 family phage tail tape measure protein
MILGTNSVMGIGVAIDLRDNFTQQARTVTAAMGKMHDKVDKLMATNLQHMRNIGLGMATAGAFATAGFGRMMKAGIDFTYTMGAVEAVTQQGQTSMKELHDLALAISKSSIHTANEIGDAMKYLGMAGLSRTNIKETIAAVSDLGAATDTAIGGVEGGSDILSNIMQQFNLGADSSRVVADLLTAAVTRSNTNLSSLGQAIYYAGGEFSALNIPLEETVGLMATIAGSGYRGSFAGTGAMNMLNQLSRALGEFRTARQAKVLEQWGLTPEDVFQMKDGVAYLKTLPELIENIGGKIDKGIMGATQIEALFRKRGARAFMAAMRDPKVGMNLREMTNFLKTESAGKAAEIAGNRIDNLRGDLWKLTSAWTAFTIAIQESLDGTFRKLVPALTSVINVLTRFIETPLGKVITHLVAAMLPLVTVGGVILTVFGAIGLVMQRGLVSMKSLALAFRWVFSTGMAKFFDLFAGGKAKEFVGKGGQFVMKGVKGFQKGAVAAASGGVVSMGLRGVLGRLVGALTGPIGILAGIGIQLIGIERIFKHFKFGVGTIANYLFWVIDGLSGIFKHGFMGSFRKATRDLRFRQDIAKYELLGVGHDPRKRQKYINEVMNEDYMQPVHDAAMRILMSRESSSSAKQNLFDANYGYINQRFNKMTANVGVNIDGQEIGRAQADFTSRSLAYDLSAIK